MDRKIIHIDMDSFFASVEQRNDVTLQGKPIAVGFDGPRGVVSTASYEARKYGVHSAMSIAKAYQMCPPLIVVTPHFEHYKEVSSQVHAVFRRFTDIIEPLSLDEAFLDVTQDKQGIESAEEIALVIKESIRKETGLTASAGVSYNKFLAKVASDWKKPDGLFVIRKSDADAFISRLPIEKFWGVGPRTASEFHHIGVFCGADLRKVSLPHLVELFGKSGNMYYDFARGIDNRPVIVERERKSVGCERTFLEDITNGTKLLIELYHIVNELLLRIDESKFEGLTLTLKVKFDDFTQVTRSHTSRTLLVSKEEILPKAKDLLRQLRTTHTRPVRLIGLSVSHADASEMVPPDLFEN